jgi:hypothetical protein
VSAPDLSSCGLGDLESCRAGIERHVRRALAWVADGRARGLSLGELIAATYELDFFGGPRDAAYDSAVLTTLGYALCLKV